MPSCRCQPASPPYRLDLNPTEDSFAELKARIKIARPSFEKRTLTKGFTPFFGSASMMFVQNDRELKANSAMQV